MFQIEEQYKLCSNKIFTFVQKLLGEEKITIIIEST